MEAKKAKHVTQGPQSILTLSRAPNQVWRSEAGKGRAKGRHLDPTLTSESSVGPEAWSGGKDSQARDPRPQSILTLVPIISSKV